MQSFQDSFDIFIENRNPSFFTNQATSDDVQNYKKIYSANLHGLALLPTNVRFMNLTSYVNCSLKSFFMDDVD